MIGRPALATALVVVTTLAACASILAPQRDPSRFFALSVAVEREPGETAPRRDPRTIGVGPVRLPAYLDRNEIATRLSATELSYSPKHRWAAPLRESFVSVLVQDLALRLDGTRVVVFPWTVDAVDLQIEVDVRHFESDASETARLVARWTARDAESGEPIVVRDVDLVRRAEGEGPGAAVAALSTALAALAGEIAVSLPR